MVMPREPANGHRLQALDHLFDGAERSSATYPDGRFGVVSRLDLDRIRAAVPQIDPVFRQSPQYELPSLNDRLGCSVTLKVETLNPVRSFKGRGTDTVVSHVVDAGKHASMVCASAGNLGQALAYSAKRRGLSATVFAALTANALKVERMRAFGAEVRLDGDDIEVPRQLAREHADRHGAYLVEDSLDIGTCEGAATIALELLDAPADFDVVLVALGGGALASGVGYVMREMSPGTQVVTVQPAGADAMTRSWHQREVVNTEMTDTIADGVAGRFPIPEVLADLLEVIDDAVLVSEAGIKRAMAILFDFAGLVVEPAAALGVATLLENPERFAGRRVATILCGSNVGPPDFRAWVAEVG